MKRMHRDSCREHKADSRKEAVMAVDLRLVVRAGGWAFLNALGSFYFLGIASLRLTPWSAARSVIDSNFASARTASSRRSLSGSRAATLPDRFMRTPQLK